MKKLFFTIVMLWGIVSTAQIQAEKTGGQIFEGYTSTTLNGLSTKPNGLLIRNSTENTLWYWNGTEFLDPFAGGSSYVFSTGLTNTSDTITVNNATIAPLWTNVSGRPTVINNLTSTSTTDPLSAAQGKVLQDGKFPYTGGKISGSITVKQNASTDANDLYISSGGFTNATIRLIKVFDSIGTGNLSISRNTGQFSFSGPLFQNNGAVQFTGLGGTGERMVVANSSGVLSTQSIPSGSGTDDQTLSEVLAEGNIMDANILLDSDVTRSIGNVTNALSSIYNRSYIFKPQTSDPTYTVNLGQTFYRSDLGRISYWNGSEVKRLATTDDDQTLFLSGANNQFINISGGNSVDITGTINNITSTASNSFIKKNIRIATTANITLSGLQSIDGNTTADGERVLVKDQTDPKENGIYIASSGTWSRSPEAAISQNLARAYIYVYAGNTMYDKFFLTSFDRDDDIGVDDVIFTETPFVLGGSGSMTPAQVKDSLLANADTNVLTDAEQTKLGYMTLSDNWDMDAAKVSIANITLKADKISPTFSGNVVVPDGDASNEAVNLGQLNSAVDISNLLGTETATTSRTALLTDADGILQITNASAMTYTVPTNASVAFPVGTVISIKQMGAGPVTLAYSGGVTGEAGGTYAKNDRIVIRKTATDTWEVLQHPTFREMTAVAYAGITPIDGILYVIVD